MTDARYEQLVRRLDPAARLQRVWALTGGITAQTTALEFVDATQTIRTVVLRRIPPPDPADGDLTAAQHFRLLRRLHAQGLPVPEPLLLDDACTLLAEPWFVVDYIHGAPRFDPVEPASFAAALARELARIHATCEGAEYDYVPQQGRVCERLLASAGASASLRTQRWALQLAARWPPPQHNPDSLLHGDFWPGNLLWDDTGICGVIDWGDALVGDPLRDLAAARLELRWLLGAEAVEQFTRAYCRERALDLTSLPYWDLLVALRPGADLAAWAALTPGLTEQRMNSALEEFAAEALEGVEV